MCHVGFKTRHASIQGRPEVKLPAPHGTAVCVLSLRCTFRRPCRDITGSQHSCFWFQLILPNLNKAPKCPDHSVECEVAHSQLREGSYTVEALIYVFPKAGSKTVRLTLWPKMAFSLQNPLFTLHCSHAVPVSNPLSRGDSTFRIKPTLMKPGTHDQTPTEPSSKRDCRRSFA